MLSLIAAELLQLQFRRALHHADTRAVVPATALLALKPDIFSFALSFGHKSRLTKQVRLFEQLLAPRRPTVATTSKDN
jgi:hypothetical protein